MDKYKKLNIQRAIFTSIIFIIFGVMVVTEKGGDILKPKVSEKINEYLQTNYKEIINNTTQNELNYKDRTFTMKITDKQNDKHYFYVTYDNGKITDTYKEDYQEGKTLLNNIKKDLEKEIYEKTKINANVNILSSLDEYTSKVQELIIKEENLSSIKIYSIEINIEIKNGDSKEITKEINNILTLFKDNNINTKYIDLTINNTNNVTESILINNITEEFLTNKNNEQIISDIINNKNTNIIKENNITYKYLN